MPDFASRPYDGTHPLLAEGDGGTDWRGGDGIGDILGRAISYGNYGGFGNRIEGENGDYVAQQRAANPDYDPTTDPKFAGDPRYAPVDPMDAAMQQHDSAYAQLGGNDGMFGWDGMHERRDADNQLASSVGTEMAQNGDKYSAGARTYASGLEGFFDGREAGMEAADWAGAKTSQAESGVENFVAGASQWSSLSDVGHGLATGAGDALGFVEGAGAEAAHGVEDAASTIGKLGVPGALTAAAGFGDAVVAGGIHAAEGALADVESLF